MSNDRFSNYGAGKVAGAIEERERIIKLLEDNLHDWTSGLHLLNFKVAGIDDLIALIKEENK